MDEKTEILYLAKNKIKTKILSLMEQLEGFTETLAPLRSPEFIIICRPYPSEAMLSATSAYKNLDPIRVSKPTTKASEARLYVSSVTWEKFSYPSEAILSAKSEAMLSAKSASWKFPWSFGLGNPSESFDPICNLRGDEGIGKGIGGGWGMPIEGIGLCTRRLCDPAEFGFLHVGDRVEHRGESSSGGGGSGEQSSGGGNERTGGGRQGGGIEGRQGIVRAGEHGGGNRDDDDGNNGGGRRNGDIENGWIPRILREQQNLAVIFLPLTLEVVTVCFGLDDANLSAFDSVLRCFALVCCQWSLVLFMASLLESDESSARNYSAIGAILTAVAVISIIAVKLPPNLRFINGLAFVLVLAIFLKAYLA